MRARTVETTVAHKVFEALVNTATLPKEERTGSRDSKTIMALSLRISKAELEECKRKELPYRVISAKYRITKEQLYLVLKAHGLVNPAKRSLEKCQKNTSN